MLIIEDEPFVAELIKVNLNMRGIHTVSASNGYDGLKLLQTGHPKIVLLDVRLPDISGWDICKKIKEKSICECCPVVIFLTAAAQEFDKKKGEEAGADAYITKPFEIDTIVSIVRRYLDRQL